MPAGCELQHARLFHLWTHPATQRRRMSKACEQIALRDAPGGLPHPGCRVQQLATQPGKEPPLDLAGPLLRSQNFRLVVLQLRRGEALCVHQGLLSLVVCRDRSTIRLSDFQVIPKDGVEPYFETSNAC